MDVAVAQDFVYALTQFEGATYAARASGLYRSTNQGQSWENVLKAIQLKSATATSLFSTEGILLAGSVGGLFRKDEQGWQAVPFRNPSPTLSAFALASDGKTLFASSLEDGVFRSEDQGKTWTTWNMGLFDLHVLSLAVHDTNVYAGTETGLYVSRNNAKSWTSLETPFDDAVLSLLGDNGNLYAGTESQGLYLFDNNWMRLEFAEGSVNGLVKLNKHLLTLVDDVIYKADGATFNRIESLHNISCLAATDEQKAPVGFNDGTVRWEEL